jgi:antitoxin component YwqK of YwqJK toxin-antitoxin module
VNDTLDGISRVYYPNRTIRIEGNYLKGKFTGKWLYWDEYGNVIGEGNFIDGSGTMRTWNSLGKLMFITEYRNNMKNGKEIAYNEEGEVIREMLYVDNEMIEANFFDGSLVK